MEPSPARFRAVYGGFHVSPAGLGTCNRNDKASRARSIYYLHLYRKHVPSPALKYYNR